MGGASSSGSFLANMGKRRDQLNKARKGLLDRPGLPPKQGRNSPAPAQAPDGDKTSNRENALKQFQERKAASPNEDTEQQGVRRQKTGAGTDAERRVNKAILNIDPEQRKEMLAEATAFIQEVKRAKRAQLHKTTGRAARFWGGGL